MKKEENYELNNLICQGIKINTFLQYKNKIKIVQNYDSHTFNGVPWTNIPLCGGLQDNVIELPVLTGDKDIKLSLSVHSS